MEIIIGIFAGIFALAAVFLAWYWLRTTPARWAYKNAKKWGLSEEDAQKEGAKYLL